MTIENNKINQLHIGYVGNEPIGVMENDGHVANTRQYLRRGYVGNPCTRNTQKNRRGDEP